MKSKATNAKITKQNASFLYTSVENLILSKGSRAINLSIFENQVVAITGLIGSGKSKLASILFGASNAQGGSIKLGNKKIRQASWQLTYRRRVNESA